MNPSSPIARARASLPRWRAAIDLFSLAVCGVIMFYQGAPAWSYTLLAYASTRCSTIDLAAATDAVQSSIRARAAPPARLKSERVP